MNVTMVTKLCNVVLRRPYLDELVQHQIEAQDVTGMLM